MFNKKHRVAACLTTLLLLVFLPATTFGQGTGASLTGTVQDASGGVVQGATIIVRNVDTGVETRATSSDRGNYTFPSLQVGTYAMTAEAPGFNRATRDNIRLNVGAQSSLNITLAVAGTVTTVDVTGTVDSVILEAGASTGTIIQEDTLASIPMLTNNVMDLINLMGGVTPTNDPSFSPGSQTFAGVSASNINVSRDGLTVNEVRLSTGINASTNINPEMIGEFRMVLSPVDAEMGRGAGQVQMTTRSGSNAYHGSGVWNIQNTALDAKDFSQKLANVQVPWRNMNNYMLTASGPVIKNKTFFFVTWEQQISRIKYAYTAKALSNCARVGIYRYIGGAVPGAAMENNSFNDGGDTRPSVDFQGNILDRKSGASFMDQRGVVLGYDAAHPSSYVSSIGNTLRTGDGEMQFESIFGPLKPEARRLIEQDMYAAETRDGSPGGPCTAFANNRAYWDPSTSDPNNPNRFGVTQLWEDRANLFGVGTGRQGSAYRYSYDPTGFVERFTYGTPDSNMVMPPVNYWGANGDGLNVASHRWTRKSIGGREGTIYGTGGDPDRKSLTFKVDHNINNDHRVSGTYTHENFIIDEAEAQWPEEYGGFGGAITRRPRTFQGSLTSTIRPTLLNEFRFGYMKSNTWTSTSMHQNPEYGNQVLSDLMPTNYTAGNVALIGVGEGTFDFHTDEMTYNWGSHPVGSRGAVQASQGSIDNRWTFADTVTWMKGAHSFKGGVEYRRQGSIQQVEGNLAFGRGMGGQGAVSPFPSAFGGLVSGVGDRRLGMLYQHANSFLSYNDPDRTWKNVPASGRSTDRHATDQTGAGWNGDASFGNAPAGLFTGPYQLMTYFSGSIARVSQYFFMVPENGVRWSDPTSPDERIFETDVRNQELSFFFKDDWRVNNSLTLNIGVRWEYYGVPHAADGKTISIVGDRSNIFGPSQPVDRVRFMHERSLRPEYENIQFGSLPNGTLAANYPIAPVTRYEYIGSGTSRSDRMAWNRDLNNFAPHLGFAWQLPWFGRGLTTLRGGWSMSYSPVGTLGTYDGWVANVGAAQLTRSEHFTGEGVNTDPNNTTYYMDLTDLGMNQNSNLSGMSNYDVLPMRVRGGILPMVPVNVGYFGAGATAIDENIKNPYTHSVNMSLTRNIGRNLTVDVRYIGTFGRNQITGTNINNTNYVNSYGYNLADELNKVRRGESSRLIDSLLPGVATQTTNPITGIVTGTGAYGSNAALYGLTGSQQLRHNNGGGQNLTLVNYSSIADTLATGNGGYGSASGESGRIFRHGCLPEQREYPNGDMTDHVNNRCLYHAPLNFFRANAQSGAATYQSNLTLSNYHSMQAQVTLRPTHGLNFQATYTWSRALSNSGWTNYLGERNYNLTGQHRSHALNIFGSYDLPLGPRGFLFKESSSVVRKIVEGWQLSWVSAMRSGSPMSITGSSTQWGTNYPILVRPDLWDDKAGKAKDRWNDNGTFAGGRYWGDKYTRVMDTGVCNLQNLTQALYNQYCINAAGTRLMDVSGTYTVPRALALQHPSGTTDPVTGAPLAMTYQEDTIGADGVLYKKDTPIIVMRNATGVYDGKDYDPLSTGTYKTNRLTSQGTFTLDAALSKSIEFMEGKRLEIRVDAQNILNHPTLDGTAASSVRYYNGGRITNFASPSNLGMNTAGSAAVGNMPTKTQHRTFQGKLAIRF